MMRAGAYKAFLLLVNRNSLELGVEAILSMLLPNDFLIIESNSIRKVIEPGLFIVIKDSANNYIKQSCAEVIQLADKIIEFNDLNWDFHPDKVSIQKGSWKIQG